MFSVIWKVYPIYIIMYYIGDVSGLGYIFFFKYDYNETVLCLTFILEVHDCINEIQVVLRIALG